MRWGEGHGDDELILRLGRLLGIYWLLHGPAAEGLRWVDGALARRAPVPNAVRAQALFASGLLVWVAGDYPRGVARGPASVDLWREAGDTWHLALSLNVLGMLRGEQGDLEASLALCREIGHRWGIGAIALALGETERAAELAAESLRLTRSLGWLWYVPERLELLAGVALARGEPERAATVYGAAEALREASGSVRQPVFRAPYARHVAAARAALGDDACRIKLRIEENKEALVGNTPAC